MRTTHSSDVQALYVNTCPTGWRMGFPLGIFESILRCSKSTYPWLWDCATGFDSVLSWFGATVRLSAVQRRIAAAAERSVFVRVGWCRASCSHCQRL